MKAQLEKTEKESEKSALEESTKWKEKVDGLNSELTKYVSLQHLLNLLDLCAVKDPFLTNILCAPNEKQKKENLVEARRSHYTEVECGIAKDHG